MKDFFKKEENRISVIVFVIVMLVAFSKLFTKLCINGHDISYHLLRIEALKEGILIGKPFLKVNVLFLGETGYASSMFYPDFLLYIPALLRVMGVGINSSYHIFVAMCIILTYVTTFISTKGICKNTYAGTIAAVVLTLCNYHLDDIYVRSAVGEYTAFIFIPLIIYGIYNTVYESMDKPYLLGIGYCGLLLCHTLSFAFCAVVTVIVFMLKIKTFIKNPKVLLKLLSTALLSILVTCSYWLPMMEQLLKDKFYVSEAQWSDLALNAKQAASVFYPAFPTLGFAVVIVCLPLFFINKANRTDDIEYGIILSVLAVIFTIVTTDLFPWKRLERFLSSVQFPWRLYIIASVLFAMAAGIILMNVASSVKLSKFIIFTDKTNGDNITESLSGKVVLFLVMALMIATAFDSFSKNDQGYYDYSNDYYSYKPFTGSVIGAEWLPARVGDVEALIEQSDSAISDTGSEVSFYRYKNEVIIESNNGIQYVDVPLVYYLGYSAVTDNSIALDVDGSGNNGLTRVYTNGYDGKVRVFYKGTFLQHMSKGVTLSGFVLLALIILAGLRRKNK